MIKHTPIKYLIVLILITAGYLIGLNQSTQSLLIEKSNNNIKQTPGTTVQMAISSVNSNEPQKNTITNNSDFSTPNLMDQLYDSDTDARLSALFFIWRNQMTGEYHNEITMLANDDPDQQVSSFAQWITQDETETEEPLPTQQSLLITDNEDPDSQIALSLTEDSYQYQQTNELTSGEQDLLEPMHHLTEEEQLEYIKELIELHEDQSVEALTELITHHNPKLQNAAIEGLISVLEMQTGHFNIISQSLEQYYVYLSEEQSNRFRNMTQPNVEE